MKPLGAWTVSSPDRARISLGEVFATRADVRWYLGQLPAWLRHKTDQIVRVEIREVKKASKRR